MGWATPYIARLAQGETVRFRPRGASMHPRIRSGELCTVEPIPASRKLQAGQIVLCTVRGKQYLHWIKAVNAERCLIGNNQGGLNGWIRRGAVHGLLVDVET